MTPIGTALSMRATIRDPQMRETQGVGPFVVKWDDAEDSNATGAEAVSGAEAAAEAEVAAGDAGDAGRATAMPQVAPPSVAVHALQNTTLVAPAQQQVLSFSTVLSIEGV